MRQRPMVQPLVVLITLTPLISWLPGAGALAQSAGQTVEHPDGLITITAGDGNARVSAPDGSNSVPVTTDGTPARPYLDPVWSPDGTLLMLTHVVSEGQIDNPDESVTVVIGRGVRRNIPGGGPCRPAGFMPDSEHLAWHCGEYRDETIDPDIVDLEQWSMGFLTQTGLDGEDPELILPYSRAGEPRWGSSRPDGRLYQDRMQVAGDGSAILSNEMGIANYLSAYSLDDGDRGAITTGRGRLIGNGPEVIATTCSESCGFPGYHPILTLERYDLDGTLLQTYDTYPQDVIIDLTAVTTDQRTLWFRGSENDGSVSSLYTMDLETGDVVEQSDSWLAEVRVECGYQCIRFAFQPAVAGFVVPGRAGGLAAAEPTDGGANASTAPDVYSLGQSEGQGTDGGSGAESGSGTEAPVYRGGDGGGDPILIHYPGWVFYAAKTDDQWDLYAHNPRSGEDVRLTDTAWDEWAPAGNRIADSLYFLSDEGGTTQLWVTSPEAYSSRSQVTEYAGPGEIAYFHYGPEYLSMKLTVADQEAGEAWLLELKMGDGSIVPYADSWRSLPSFTPAGNMIYVSWTGSETDILVDRDDGTTSAIADSPANEDNPALSPDGTRLAYNVENEAGRQIVVQNLGTGDVLTLPQLGDDSDPVWSPDGTRLAFVSNDGVSETIWVVPANGSAGAEPLGIPACDNVWYLDWPE